MKLHKVLYHSGCLDGLAAAYAAKVGLNRATIRPVLVPVNYGEEPPDVERCYVSIVDFSYPRDVLLEVKDKAETLVVLDHHKTAQEALSGLPFALFDMNRSGAVMAWEYFNHGYTVPKLLLLIQDRDLWRFDFPETKDVSTALYSMLDEGVDMLHKYVEMGGLGVDELATMGATLNKAFNKEVQMLSKHPVPITLNGVKGLAVNATSKYSSELGNLLAVESGKFGAVFYLDGKRGMWNFSLRSVGELDVSEIAKAYSGGGHKNAAGFSIPCHKIDELLR